MPNVSCLAEINWAFETASLVQVPSVPGHVSVSGLVGVTCWPYLAIQLICIYLANMAVIASQVNCSIGTAKQDELYHSSKMTCTEGDEMISVFIF